MDYSPQNIFRNINRDILHYCASQGQPISKELVAFIIKTVILNPDNNFDLNAIQTKDDIQRIIELSIKILMDDQAPRLDTIKMQVFFGMNYLTRDQFIMEQEVVSSAQTKVLLSEIVKSQPRTRNELNAMYDKIIMLLVLWSGLDRSVVLISIKETRAALQSIFPQPELGSFLGLDETVKTCHLKELCLIVSGIRLFNKDCEKGGKTIVDLPQSTHKMLQLMIQIVEEGLTLSKLNAFKSIAILEQIDEVDPIDEKWQTLIWQTSINARQHVAYLQTMKNDLMQCLKEVIDLQNKLQEKLKSLHLTVQARIAIPTNQVYPKFIQLGKIWKRFQNEMYIIQHLHNINKNIDIYTMKRKEIMKNPIVETLLTKVSVITDENRLTESVKTNPVPSSGPYVKVEVLHEDQISQSKHIYAIQGFCCWALVRKHLLIPGNKTYGIIKYKNKYYLMSSPDSLLQFSHNPEWYVDQLLLLAKRNPDLIQLLQLYSQLFPSQEKKSKACISEIALFDKIDSGTQTEIHPIKSNLDPTYQWNEWQMRNHAIKLANLQSKLTSSSQTTESHLRRENSTQVYLPKNKGTQTSSSIGTNTIKHQHYLSGLQGYRNGCACTFRYVDLSQQN